MAQTGFTPLLIYSSSTATNAPTAGNLLNNATGSELAINIADGKLFYKDSSNAVQVIGWKTTPTTAGGTGLTSYTAGDMVYWASGTTFTKLGIGASGTVLTSSGSAPQWSTSLSVSGSLTAAAGLVSTGTFTGTPPADGIVVDYATGFGRFSAFTGDGFQWFNAGVGTTKLMQLSSTGVITTATWNGATIGTGYGGTGLTSFTANGVVYASSTSALTTGSGLTFDGTNLTLGTSATAGTTYLRIYNSNAVETDSYIGSTLTSYIYSDSTQVIVGSATNIPYILKTNGTERARVTNVGDFLIGRTTASSASDTGFTISKQFNYISIGHTSAVNVSGDYYLSFAYGGGVIGSITQNATSGVLYNITSDSRLKTDLGISTDISVIDNTIIHDFSWNVDGTIDRGVFAQEAYKTKPSAVQVGQDDVNEQGKLEKPWGVDYSKYVPDIIVYCQQLKATITELQDKLKSAGVAGF